MVIGDVLSMIPFLIPAYIVNDMYLSGAFILMTITGLLHHYYAESRKFLIFDFIAIIITTIAITIKTDLHEHIKNILILLQLCVVGTLIGLRLLKIELPWRIYLIIMNIAVIPAVVFWIPFLSNISKVLVSISLINYGIHCCSCNPKYEFHDITWGTFHIFVALTAYFVLNDLKLVKPQFSIKRPL
jgi:hypothetical protein